MGRTKYPGVRQASATSIEISFTYQGQQCRERVKLSPTPANLKAAARHREAILDAIAKGVFDYTVTFPDSPRAIKHAVFQGDAITLEQWLLQWHKIQKAHVSSSTYRDYTNSVRLLIEAFGPIKLTELRRLHIKTWAANLTCSNKRIANLLSPLRIALQEALEDELIETNPLYGWTFSRKEKPKEQKIQPFSQEEQKAILDALPPMGRNFIQFAFWTGMRSSELLGLKWSDVDWIGGTISVERARTGTSKEPEVTKTPAGRRMVKLLGPAIEALKAQKAHSFLRADGYIWINPLTLEPWVSATQIRNTMWVHALKKAGVRYRNPYQTRHTYASMTLSSGENPLWVAQQMGHADTKMIFRCYGRWIPDATPDAGAKTEQNFNNSPAPKTPIGSKKPA